MLVIRLRRIGKKSHPTYRVVVAEHTNPVNGKFTADLGFYNPHTKATSLTKEDVTTWLDKGAKPSNTVAKLLEKQKVKHNLVVVVKKKKRSKKAQDQAVEKAASAAVESPAVETVEEQPAEAAESSDAEPEPESESAS